MVFIVDNLYKENTNNIENFVKNKDLTMLYEIWNEMYMISRYEVFKEKINKRLVLNVYQIISTSFQL
ncbi:hypothetical protein C1646_764942 [Rhizophagus diaphanus]|nr:hypothetical protein C1646_764942 [Rhizophagus diaphanus] [Rhizophagus sp. MUCL 43196]